MRPIIPYVIATASIYIADHLVRLWKIRICQANVYANTLLEATVIELLGLKLMNKPGQFLSVRVITMNWGWRGLFKGHPVMIAGRETEENGLSLICMRTESEKWSKELYTVATERKALEGNRTIRVMVEGPYGMLSLLVENLLFAMTDGSGASIINAYDHSTAIFICGDAGIPLAYSAMLGLMERSDRPRRVTSMELVYIRYGDGGEGRCRSP